MELKKMNKELEQELKEWEKVRKEHNEYLTQLEYFKKIKKNVPLIVDFWSSLSDEKRHLLEKRPVVYYIYKAWEEGIIESIEKFTELNEQYYILNEKNGKNYSNSYFEISKELLSDYNIDTSIYDQWDENKYGLNEFFDANKKYYSKLIENEDLPEILDLLEDSLNVNSTKSSQGGNKKAINKGERLSDIFEMFLYIYENNLSDFEEIVPKVSYLNKIAKEVFGFYNLDKGAYIFNSKIIDFTEYFYKKTKIMNPSDIKNEFQDIKQKYQSVFKDDLYVKNISDNLSDMNLSSDKIRNIQINMQIDQFIYHWSKTNKEKMLSTPFSEIFENREQAEIFFEDVKEKLELLGINSSSDKKFTITIPKKGNRKLIRVIYGAWVVLDFEKFAGESFYRIALKMSDELSRFKESNDPFKTTIENEKYNLYEVPIKNVAEIDHLINESFIKISKIFSEYQKSPYSNRGYQELKDAVFDEKKRKKVLKKKFNLKEQEDIIEPMELNKGTNLENNGPKNYFWVTANPKLWKARELEKDGSVFYTSTNMEGNKRRIYSAFKEAKENDEVIIYESTPVKKIVAEGKILKGLHYDTDPISGENKKGISIGFTRKIQSIRWNALTDIEDLKNCNPILNGAQGSLFKLNKSEFETILSLEEFEEVQDYMKDKKWKDIADQLSYVNVNSKFELKKTKLFFEEEEENKINKMVTQAISQGKHIVLIGPPGTGKSKLAKLIAENYVGNDNYCMTTAISDWSTFDTIGGLHPKERGELEFKQGLILDCFKKEGNDINKWFIIDEINRADIDKAFGYLFSALTGDTTTLSYEINNNNIKVFGKPSDKEVLGDYKYFIHPDWRIIATMNSLDKASLYEMSYAFMRRFAFIPVNIPSNIDNKLIRTYCNCWGIEDLDESKMEYISTLWNILSDNEVQVGPSIIEDICRYVKNKGSFEEAITMFVLPQLEGKTENDVEKLLKDLESKEIIKKKVIEKDFSTFLGFKI